MKRINLKNGYQLVFNPEANTRKKLGELVDRSRYTLQLIGENNEVLEEKALKGATTILNAISKPYLGTWYLKMMASWIKNNCSNPDKTMTLTPADIEKAMKAHTEKSDDAKDVGTKAHAFIESWIKWRMVYDVSPNDAKIIPPVADKEIEHITDRFIKWAEKNVKTFLASEESVCSVKYGYAGTFDFLYEDNNGKIGLGDFKTSNQQSDEYLAQCASYMIALHEMGNKLPDFCVIVRSDKMTDEEIEIYNKTDKRAYSFPKVAFDVVDSWKTSNNFKMFFGALLITNSGAVDFDIEMDIDAFIENNFS